MVLGFGKDIKPSIWSYHIKEQSLPVSHLQRRDTRQGKSIGLSGFAAMLEAASLLTGKKKIRTLFGHIKCNRRAGIAGIPHWGLIG